jgi:hypothetical protein
MINLYVLSLVLAAILLVAALFFSSPQGKRNGEARSGEDPPRPSQIGQLEGVGAGDFMARTMRSRMFWTFFASFFGMTGLVLDGLDLMSPAVALIVAAAVGAVGGAGANAAFRIGA